MFDLDMIETDWLNNSFRLSEEQIIEIYRSENITLSKYCEQIGDCGSVSAEERILRSVFGEDKGITEKENELHQKNPTKQHLSKDLQKKVIEGSLYIVFNSTRQWYNFFSGQIPMESLYYVCLEALINSVKYMVHCEKPVFELYVLKSIERNMIKHMARWKRITYREAYKIIDSFYRTEDCIFLQQDSKEQLEKPSKIFYRQKNEWYDVDYIKNISSSEFMRDYIDSLNKLDEDARIVMQMSFDVEGNRGLTNAEIADYLGFEPQRISDIRRKAIKTLRKDMKLNMYRDHK